MTPTVIFLILCGFAAILMVGYYNALVTRRNMTEQAYSTIDVMLQKRFDLIPNFVAVARKYMEHESSTLTRIAQLRSRVGDSKVDSDARVSAANELQRNIGTIMVQVEKYPQLKAEDCTKKLMNTLENVEEQLSAARRTFNAAVTLYNNSVEMFPSNVIAGIFRFKRRVLLETAPESKKNPDVNELFNRS